MKTITCSDRVYYDELPVSYTHLDVYKRQVSVRFKNSRKAYSFGTNDETLEYGDYVVVETVRGVEMGEIISNLRDVSMHTQNTPLKPVLRKATRHDREMYAENKDLAKEALSRCQEAVARLKLDMNPVSYTHLDCDG